MSRHEEDIPRQQQRRKRSGTGQTLRPIVVGVDGTPGSQVALAWAVEAARLRQLPLEVVLAADPSPAVRYYPYIPPDSSETFVLREPSPAPRTAAAFERAMAYARDRLPADTVIGAHTQGRTTSVLTDASWGATMMVVGSRGRSAIASALLGSVSATVAAHAMSPVVVVRGDGQGPPGQRQVVVGVDGSKDAHLALGFGFIEASVRKLPMQIVFCWPAIKDAAADKEAIFARRLPKLSEQLTAYQEEFPDVIATTSLLHGDPAVKLTEQSIGAELIVIGSRGRGRVTSLLLGSVSQDVLRHAHCPVVIARRPTH